MKKWVVSVFAVVVSAICLVGVNTNTDKLVSAESLDEAIVYTIQDIRNLQDFLLTRPTEEDLSGKDYDLNHDGVWDVFDLCLMKREFLSYQPDDTNILVAYFSRAGENYNVGVVEKGSTEIVAEMIATETGADTFKIEAVYDYPSDYMECVQVAREEQNAQARPELRNTLDNIDEYDIIFVGYPIWHADMPMAVYTFLESYDFADKTIIPFCTHAGSGLARTESSIRSELSDSEILSGLAIAGTTVQNTPDTAQTSVCNWLEELNINQQSDEDVLKELFNARCQAMIDMDIETLDEMMDDALLLHHITGAVQTKAEWLDCIANEEMRYFNINTTSLEIEVSGDVAVIKHTNEITARIYGSNGTWTLTGESYYIRKDGKWIWTNKPEGLE